MAIPSLELQRAIYGALSPSYQVYDVVPNDAPFPYITIGTETITTDDTKNKKRTVHTITIDTWTKGTSSLGSKELNNFVLQTIDADLAVNGFFVQFVSLELLTTFEETDVDGTIFHGVIQFEITLQEVD